MGGENLVPETDPTALRRDDRRPAPRWVAPLAGVVAGLVGVAAAEVLAVATGAVSPYDAVGSAVIDATPAPVVDLAIAWFGTADKFVLRLVMSLIIAALALLAGARARRHRRSGAVIVAAGGLFGAALVAGRPGTGAADVAAPLLGAAAGIAALWWLIGLVTAADPLPVPTAVPVSDTWDRRRVLGTLAAVTASGGAILAGSRRLVSIRAAEGRETASTLLDAAAPPALPPVPPVPETATLSPITPFITPNDDFYRIDTALSFPRTQPDRWRLSIEGLVERPRTWSYGELLERATAERIITIACVSNQVGGDLVGTARWQGVLLADVLAESAVLPEAEQIFSTSLDGWTCGFPTAAAFDGRDAMIALLMNGEPLPLRHGFPARLVVPGLYGYVSATKWLRRIELTTWQAAEGYWVPLGWAREAPIVTQSRIDVPRRGVEVPAGDVVVAGVAWAPQRGITKVEVSIDDEDWQPAELGDALSDDAWRQWRLVWTATPGDHTVRVRATDGTGEVQTEVVAPPDPSGATGYHRRRVRVV